MRKVEKKIELRLTNEEYRKIWNLIGRWRLNMESTNKLSPDMRGEARVITIERAKDVEQYITTLINEAYELGLQDGKEKGQASGSFPRATLIVEDL